MPEPRHGRDAGQDQDRRDGGGVASTRGQPNRQHQDQPAAPDAGGNRQLAIHDHAQTGCEKHPDQRVLAPAVRHGSQSFVRHAASPALPTYASGSVQVCPRRIGLQYNTSARRLTTGR